MVSRLPSVLVADPPWKFGDSLPGPGRGASKHYPCMDVWSICNFALPEMAEDAYLFLWRVSSMVLEAYTVCSFWGFTPKTELVWRKMTKTGKQHFGMGWHLRAAHESCIVAVRGNPRPLVRNVRSVFDAPVGRHSAKPDEFYDIVEMLSPGPYVELFARRHRPGWQCHGNELEDTNVKRDNTVRVAQG
jgi:N6-adenosine-specific RNA methylase IME4